MPLNRLGLAWQINDYTTSGLTGLHLALSLIKNSELEPLLYTMPRMITPPLGSFEALRPYVEEMKLLLQEVESSKKSAHLKTAVVLHDLHCDLVWRESSVQITGSKNVGLAFFKEQPNAKAAIQRASLLDRVIVRAQWHETVLRDYGIENVSYWRPGYDDWLFYPRDKADNNDGHFIIYSGGDLQLANAQDTVLAAFKIFHEKHPDARLVTHWQTPFHGNLAPMAFSPHNPPTLSVNEDNSVDFAKWAVDYGIPEEAFIDIGMAGAQDLPAHISQADVAIFANRCTGGPNSAAVEVMAMGIPCILSQNTGHLDIIEDGNCLTLQQQVRIESADLNTNQWGESSIDEILEHLEWAYENRDEARAIGAKAADSIKPYTWKKQTQDFLENIADLIATEN